MNAQLTWAPLFLALVASCTSGSSGDGPTNAPGEGASDARSVEGGGEVTDASSTADASTGTFDCDAGSPRAGSECVGEEAITVSVGNGFACAVKADATVACWGGSNESGEATPPPGLFKSVSASGGYACGLKVDGSVTCWGRSAYEATDSPAGTFKSVRSSTAATNSCATKQDATLACWGATTRRHRRDRSGPSARVLRRRAG
jgi:hypothetical protein